MSGDILTVKTVKRVRSVRGSALVHIIVLQLYNVHIDIIHYFCKTDVNVHLVFTTFIYRYMYI